MLKPARISAYPYKEALASVNSGWVRKLPPAYELDAVSAENDK